MARKRPTSQHDQAPADPLAWMTPEQRQRHETLLAKMLLKPRAFGPGGDHFRVLYVLRDGGQVMIWHPDSPEEAREIRAFHDAAHGLGEFARTIKPGSPIQRSAEERALLGGILQDRTERTGYLVYADYLTENDDPQGDIIRLSVELEQIPRDYPARAGLVSLQNELVHAHWEHIYRGLVGMGLPPIIAPFDRAQPWVWLSSERGVIEEVVIDRPRILPDNADRLFAAAPLLRKLVFERGHFDAAGLAKVEQLGQIETLALSDVAVTPEDLAVLFRSKYLIGLKTLELCNAAVGDAGMAVLAEWQGLSRLESLELHDCGVGDEGFGRLAHCPALANLRRLRIGSNPASTEAFGVLFSSPHLVSLTDLDLGSTTLDSAMVAALRTASFARHLEQLSLASAIFRSVAFADFVRCPLPALKGLRLDNVDLRGPAADQLTRAEFSKTLEQLYLDNCRLGNAGAELFTRGKFPLLTTLDLSRNRLGGRAAGALSRAANRLPRLTSIKLWSNRFGPDAVVALAGSRVLANVTSLELNDNRIGPRGAKALAGSKHLKKLVSLVVDKATAGKTGEQALINHFGEGVLTFC